jgi:DNA topoisomerase I
MKKHIIRQNKFINITKISSENISDKSIYDSNNYEFRYTTHKGQSIKPSEMSPKLKQHIKSLNIPPAYKNVKISLDATDNVLAIGEDSKNRKQYIYNPAFKSESEDIKYFNLIEFGKQYKRIIGRINRDLQHKTNCVDKEIATVLKLISECNFRIGNDIYRDNYNSYGVSTLESKHIKINGDKIDINFIGKKGVRNKCSFKNRVLSKNLSKRKNRSKHNGNNNMFNISNQQINNYLKEFGEFSSKNFRTWNANIEYIYNIQKYDLFYNGENNKYDIISLNTRKKTSNKAVSIVANKLHHSPNVCKKNYIDSNLIDKYINNGNEFYQLFKIKEHRNKNEIIEEFIKYLKESFK